MRRILLLLVFSFAACAAAAPAAASELIARDAANVTLQVDREGYALVTYRSGSATKRVLLWGAVNARPPVRGTTQVAFRRDFSGGWGTFHRRYWQTARNVCGRYDGPPLAWLVTACKAPDGSYWALQAWRRMLPNLGLAPWEPKQAVWELHASHWTGEVAELQANLDWSYHGRFHHLFGTFTYGGGGVFGFASTRSGVPLDSFGRNVYLDTFDSAYGPGWKRENSFLAHAGGGSFLLRLLPARALPGLPGGHAAGRPREPLPDHRDRPRRDAGRDVEGRRAARLRRPERRARRHRDADERRADRARRPALPPRVVH